MADTTNGRVTLAVLGTKMDMLTAKLDEHCDLHRDLDVRLREVEIEQGAQKVRAGVLAGINAAFTAIAAAAVAAFRRS